MNTNFILISYHTKFTLHIVDDVWCHLISDSACNKCPRQKIEWRGSNKWQTHYNLRPTLRASLYVNATADSFFDIAFRNVPFLPEKCDYAFHKSHGRYKMTILFLRGTHKLLLFSGVLDLSNLSPFIFIGSHHFKLYCGWF